MTAVSTYKLIEDENGRESLMLADWIGDENDPKPDRAVEGSRLITYDQTALKIRLYLADANGNWILLKEKELPDGLI